MKREELIKFAQQFYADKETCIKNVDTYLATQPQKPDKELFEKVYIRSEEDLPEEDGMYFINIKGKGIGINVCRFEVILDIQSWMSNIDWYLRPIE